MAAGLMLYHPKIKQLLGIRFVRYLLAAGTATAIDVVVYTLLFASFRQINDWPVLPDRNACAFFGGFSAGLLTNFWISKKLVFQESVLKTQTQFVRFALVAVLVLLANWFFMQLLHNLFNQYLVDLPIDFQAFMIRSVAAATVAMISFIFHKIFSFRV